MKKHIDRVRDDIWIVDSEPGDGTRYRYIIYYDGFHDFSVMPYGETQIKYPQKLNYWDIHKLEDLSINDVGFSKPDSLLVKMAKEKDCNPFTLFECIRTAMQMRSEV